MSTEGFTGFVKELLAHAGLGEFQFQINQVPSEPRVISLSLNKKFTIPFLTAENPNMNEIFAPMIEGIRNSHLVKGEKLEVDQKVRVLESELKSAWEKVSTLLPYQTHYRMQYFSEHGSWPQIACVINEDKKEEGKPK